ncbi:Uncharacterised protein [Mycobacteroides abscessus subsp. abscessus]|nr:Uncharacterised protein [Mycobacteroides abscessus subsp. abscessus]
MFSNSSMRSSTDFLSKVSRSVGMGSFAAFRKSRSMMAANLGSWSVAVMSLE